MANGRTRTVHRVTDKWAVYDALPAPIRAALQEGPQAWDAIAVRTRLRCAVRAFGSEAKGIAWMVLTIQQWHATEVAQARPWQPPRKPFQPKPDAPLPSPHILARATMQLSGHPNYIAPPKG